MCLSSSPRTRLLRTYDRRVREAGYTPLYFDLISHREDGRAEWGINMPRTVAGVLHGQGFASPRMHGLIVCLNKFIIGVCTALFDNIRVQS